MSQPGSGLMKVAIGLVIASVIALSTSAFLVGAHFLRDDQGPGSPQGDQAQTMIEGEPEATLVETRSPGDEPSPGDLGLKTPRLPYPRAGELIVQPSPPRLAGTDHDPPKNPIAWHQAGQYVGRELTVLGEIKHTNNTGKVVFLNFDTNWKGKFYLILFNPAPSQVAETHGVPAETYYKGKTVRVTGTVRSRHGVPHFQIRSIKRIEIVQAG